MEMLEKLQPELTLIIDVTSHGLTIYEAGNPAELDDMSPRPIETFR